MGGFRDDPDYVTVLALEVYDDTGTATEAPHLPAAGQPPRPAPA
jgi:hypothetical protein